MKIIVSHTTVPQENLNREQQLFTERPGEDVLFLYINAPCVVIGKNQLSEAETDLDFCRSRNIPVLRRLSGGGAVYHDSGNINFSFIVRAEKDGVLDRDFLSPVVAALKSFGIPAQIGSRKELSVNGNKISGTASHISRGRHLFHGTLLFHTDLEILHAALNGNHSLRGKYVASVPSPVTNISGLLTQKITAPEFMERLAVFFNAYFNCPSR
ncbi:MAG: lipoate--protein ligase family protein [Rikenellaceae bacterium]|nr:lipoate--protein ligase family protein [Rikenellaceae bacterium]